MLKPCPFCGAADVAHRIEDLDLIGCFIARVECKTCGAAGPARTRDAEADARTEAAAAWNERRGAGMPEVSA